MIWQVELVFSKLLFNKIKMEDIKNNWKIY